MEKVVKSDERAKGGERRGADRQRGTNRGEERPLRGRREWVGAYSVRSEGTGGATPVSVEKEREGGRRKGCPMETRRKKTSRWDEEKLKCKEGQYSGGRRGVSIKKTKNQKVKPLRKEQLTPSSKKKEGE